jgi:hypothetical protein
MNSDSSRNNYLAKKVHKVKKKFQKKTQKYGKKKKNNKHRLTFLSLPTISLPPKSMI